MIRALAESQSIRLALERNRIAIHDFAAILDFGCGSGRVTRYWRDSPAAVHGTDYTPDLIRWCERNLSFGKFQVNRADPLLGYPNDSFDLVYALSVFTHLAEVDNSPGWRSSDASRSRDAT